MGYLLRDKPISLLANSSTMKVRIMAQHGLQSVAQHFRRPRKILRRFDEFSSPNIAHEMDVRGARSIGIHGFLELDIQQPSAHRPCRREMSARSAAKKETPGDGCVGSPLVGSAMGRAFSIFSLT